MEQHLKDMWKQERNSSWMVFHIVCMLWKWSITERKLMWKGEGPIAGVMFLNPEYSLEGLMLKLKLQYFGHLMWRANSQKRQDPDAGKDWSQEEKGMTEDEMVGWHHWLNEHEFQQALGDGEGQGILVRCSPWGRKELNTTEWLHNNALE